MRVFLLVLAFAFSAEAAGPAREIRLRDIAFALNPGDRLAIVGVRGSLRLKPTPTGALNGGLIVRARTVLPAGASGAGLDRFKRLGVAVRREGGVVRVEPADVVAGGKIDWLDLAQNGMPSLDLEIEALPASLAAVDIAWRDGRVALQDWKGNVSIELIEGSFSARQTEGALRAQVRNGEARIEGHRGRLDLDSHSARLAVTGVDGDVSLESISGETVVQGVKGNTIVHAGSAPASVAKGSGNLEFEVAKGTFTAANFEGSVRGQSEEGAVSIQVDGEPEINVESTHASISIRVPASSGATVRLSTDEGQLVVPEPALKVIKNPGSRTVLGRLPGKGNGAVYAKSKTATIRIR